MRHTDAASVGIANVKRVVGRRFDDDTVGREALFERAALGWSDRESYKIEAAG